MSERTKLALFLGAAVLLLLWIVQDALRTNMIAMKGGKFDRRDEPILFWISILIMGVTGAAALIWLVAIVRQ